MFELFAVMLVLTLLLAVGSLFLMVLLRVLEERRDVADTLHQQEVDFRHSLMRRESAR